MTAADRRPRRTTNPDERRTADRIAAARRREILTADRTADMMETER